MTRDLRDRLDRLAAHAPDRVPVDDLWERGVRRGRRQRVAVTAAVAAAVVLVVALGGSLAATFRSPGIAPAPPGAEQVRLPAEIVAPGERARTATREDGPPGRLVAVVGGFRGTPFSSEMGLYGVSASTGEYIWLDLPDLDATAPVSLSPDGMHVGYWLERGEGADPGDAGMEVVDGYAILDVASGEVFRNEVESDLGLMPETIGWTPGRAWFEIHTITELTNDSATAKGQGVHLVDPGLDTVSPVRLGDAPSLVDSTSAAGGMVAHVGRGWAWVPGADRQEWVRIDDVPRIQWRLVANGDGTAFAGLGRTRGGTSADPGPIEVGVRDGSRLRWHTVPGGSYQHVVGWRGPRTVLAQGDDGWLYAVHIRTGTATPVLQLRDVGVRQAPALAAALLDAPVAPAVEIPESVDLGPWLRGALLVAVLAVGGWMVVRVRGRRSRGDA